VRRKVHRQLCALLELGAASLVAATTLPAQAFPTEFTSVGSVRELSDGRTLIADSREKRLLVLDWSTGRARDIGRTGDGPGEYRSLSQLLALPADTTVVIDHVARRWILYAGDRMQASVAPERALYLWQFLAPPQGVDSQGNVLVVAAVPWKGVGERAVLSRMPTYAESLVALRLSRDGARIDTLARLRGRPWGASTFTRGVGAQRMTYTASNPLSAPEQALLFPDGSVAVARQHPFRVEWIDRDGGRRQGPVLDTASVRATPRERAAAIARVWPEAGPPPLTEADFSGWPELVPSFPSDALLHVPGNRLAVRRQRTEAQPHERIDIISRDGSLVKRLQLAAGERAVAFGARHMYVTHTDEDGLVILSRREW
jgi:hypothetical protein